MSLSSAFQAQFRRALGLLLPDYAGSLGAGAVAATSVAASGDISAAGGFRQVIGPFMAPGAAGVTAASQTDLDCRYAHVAAFASSYVATRAGSFMGISGQLDTAATTAGAAATIAVKITKNGTELVGGPQLSFTTGGAEVSSRATAAKDAFTFAAGDLISASYTSGATLSNTPKLVFSIEIES